MRPRQSFVRHLSLVVVIVLSSWSTLRLSAEEVGPADAKPRVAVMNFENNSSWYYWGDNLGYAAADELVTQLFKTGQFTLIERSQLDAVLAEQNLGQSGRVDAAQAAEIGD